MTQIGIDAVAFYLGFLAIRWYYIMELFAFVIIFTIPFFESKRQNIPLKHIYLVIIFGLLLGLILAKVTDIVGRPEIYQGHAGRIFNPAGMRAPGLIAGFLIVKLFYCWRSRISFWKVSDAIISGVVLGAAVLRVGCFLNGCCFGIESPVTWLSVTYSGNNSLAPLNITLYAVQLYEAVWGLVIFTILWSVRKKIQPVGSVYLLFIILYALGDVITRLFRQPDAVFMGIQMQQFVNIIMMIVAIPLFIVRTRRYLRSKARD
jgi:phosphatidylglycerol---prolipoprotein diacylglyceryl transferase